MKVTIRQHNKKALSEDKRFNDLLTIELPPYASIYPDSGLVSSISTREKDTIIIYLGKAPKRMDYDEYLNDLFILKTKPDKPRELICASKSRIVWEAK